MKAKSTCVFAVARVVRRDSGENVATTIAVYATRASAVRYRAQQYRRARAGGERLWIDGGDDWRVDYLIEPFTLRG